MLHELSKYIFNASPTHLSNCNWFFWDKNVIFFKQSNIPFWFDSPLEGQQQISYLSTGQAAMMNRKKNRLYSYFYLFGIFLNN